MKQKEVCKSKGFFSLAVILAVILGVCLIFLTTTAINAKQSSKKEEEKMTVKGSTYTMYRGSKATTYKYYGLPQYKIVHHPKLTVKRAISKMASLSTRSKTRLTLSVNLSNQIQYYLNGNDRRNFYRVKYLLARNFNNRSYKTLRTILVNNLIKDLNQIATQRNIIAAVRGAAGKKSNMTGKGWSSSFYSGVRSKRERRNVRVAVGMVRNYQNLLGGNGFQGFGTTGIGVDVDEDPGDDPGPVDDPGPGEDEGGSSSGGGGVDPDEDEDTGPDTDTDDIPQIFPGCPGCTGAQRFENLLDTYMIITKIKKAVQFEYNITMMQYAKTQSMNTTKTESILLYK